MEEAASATDIVVIDAQKETKIDEVTVFQNYSAEIKRSFEVVDDEDPKTSFTIQLDNLPEKMIDDSFRVDNISGDFTIKGVSFSRVWKESNVNIPTDENVGKTLSNYVSAQMLSIGIEKATAVKKITLGVTYLVTSASWTPSYDLRLEKGSSPSDGIMNLSCCGMVTNNTGEDWNQVKVVLSMATQDVNDALSKQANMTLRGVGALQGRFVAPLFHDLRSGHKAKKIAHSLLALPATIQHVCRPDFSDRVHLMACVNNNSQQILIASDQAYIYKYGSFLGKMDLPQTGFQEDFFVFVGTDPLVCLTAGPEYPIDYAGNMVRGNTITLLYQQLIHVRNNSDEMISNIAVVFTRPMSSSVPRVTYSVNFTFAGVDLIQTAWSSDEEAINSMKRGHDGAKDGAVRNYYNGKTGHVIRMIPTIMSHGSESLLYSYYRQ